MTQHEARTGTSRRAQVSLVFLGLATALAIIDATIVNVALPSISRDLALSLSAGEWVVSGYGITLAALLISLGRVGDTLGQRRTLVAGVALFALASLGCALASDAGLLILARLVQGAGAAAVLPTVIGTINATFRGPALGVAFAVYGATIGTAAALGPLLGSALVDAFGWQAAFLINLPLAAVVVVGVLAFLLPLYLQVGRDLSPLRAQLVILPTALGSFISAPITAGRKAVPARTWVLIGLGLEVVGLLLLAAVLTPTGPNLLLAVPLLVYGTGVGFAISQLTNATLLAVPFQRIGQAAGISSTARQIGSAVGVAALTAIVSGVLSLTLAQRLETSAPSLGVEQRTALAGAIATSPAAAGEILTGVPAVARAGVHDATNDSLALGVRLAAIGAAVPIAGAWLLSRRLPTERPETRAEQAST